jgi:ribosomal protein S1
MNKGGLELDVKGMRAFMPSGQVDLYFQKDISTFIGQR